MEQNIERIINEIVNEINENNNENPQRMVQLIIPPLNNVDDEIINRTFTEQEIIKKPISKDFLETLEKKEIDKEDIDNDNNCSICMDKFKLNDNVLILPCGEQKHYFHCDYSETCSGILPWLKENNTCPICRYEFPLDDDTNDDDTNDDDTNDYNTLSEDVQPTPINNIFQHINNMMTRVIEEERSNILNEEEELQRAILNSIEES